MPRPSLVVGWLAATLVAVGIAYGGVNAVAGRVVDPLPPTLALPSNDAAAAATPSPSAAPSPSSTPAGPTSSPSTTASGAPGAPATEAPPVQPAPATATSRSYALTGGTVTLRFEPDRVTVVAAEPAQGFRLEVEGNGTAEVRVEFEGDDHRSRLRGWWDGGPADRVDDVPEHERDDADDDGADDDGGDD